MRMSKIITAALAITLISASASVAQPAGRGFDRGDRIERQVDRQVNRQSNRQDYRQANRRGYRQGNRQANRQGYRQGYRQSNRANRRIDRRNYRADMRQFRRGGRAHRYDHNEFRRFNRGHRFAFQPRRHVVVNDWHGHRLHRPPRGHHWVRNGNSGDYLLVALTTGIILDLMFNNY